MGWFSDQVKSRKENDNIQVENSFYDLSSVIMGHSKISAAINNDRIKTRNAIEEICKYFKAEICDIPDNIHEMNEQIEFLLRPSGIMHRNVVLNGKWWKKCAGPLMCATKSGDVAALMPLPVSGYRFFDYNQNKMVRVNSKTVNQLEENAMCFYRPFPREPVKMGGFMRFLMSSLSKADIIMVVLAALAVSLLGLFMPMATNLIFTSIIPSGEKILLVSIAFMLVGISVSVFLINVTKSMIQSRIQTKLDVALQGALMARVINLPARFFKDYSSGELAGRVESVNILCGMICEAILGGGLTALFSLVYIIQIAFIAKSLALPALLVTLVQLVVLVTGVIINQKRMCRQLKAKASVEGTVFSLYSGIQKIKLSGCEKRAFSKWAALYRAEAENKFNPPFFLKIQLALIQVITLAGTLLFYYTSAVSGITSSQYVAFNTSFGMVSGAILALAGMADVFSYIRPGFDMIEPILSEQPEVSKNKKIVHSFSGAIELNNVSFRYQEDGPLILDNLSLKIRRGQYIAIVGKTGCGKSTLMRMLLGFEKPQKGAIYYDGADIEKLDLRSLRRNVGVVMQNGKLFAGNIFSNITISAPWLTLDDAWKAAEITGIADDIRDMPMGMNTVISEGAGGISGGQKQRLMIARAIAPGPKILMLDEATSALDNLTQKQVSESLNAMKSTRIVIAHRLSTIKECDRIIVLDKGKIIEDGSYEKLIAQNGFFAELVSRQRLDIAETAGQGG
jgi:NHLM bacteriocin system ABC transporter ATP-binding protein